MATDRPADSPARVVVVDPRPARRATLVDAIRQHPDLEIVSQVGDGRSASKQIARLEPDVAVIELHVLGFDGLRVVEATLGDESKTRVLVLSGSQDGSIVHQAIQAGAAGCLMIDADADTIGGAIAAVARGDRAFAPQVSELIAEQIGGRDREGCTLTQRERSVLRLTADGLSAGEVATELALSESTVTKHLMSAYEKLGVSCAAAAVHEAMRLEIIA